MDKTELVLTLWARKDSKDLFFIQTQELQRGPTLVLGVQHHDGVGWDWGQGCVQTSSVFPHQTDAPNQSNKLNLDES